MEFPQRRTACRTPRRGGSLALASVAALPWHQRQRSPGIGGRRARASVAAFVWNGWQRCRGISGRIPLASVAALPWNTQLGRRGDPLRGSASVTPVLRAPHDVCGAATAVGTRRPPSRQDPTPSAHNARHPQAEKKRKNRSQGSFVS